MIDLGDTPLAPGTLVATTLGASTGLSNDRVYQTILSSEQIERQTSKPSISFDVFGRPMVEAWTTPEGRRALHTFTAAHIGGYAAIVINNVVIHMSLRG